MFLRVLIISSSLRKPMPISINNSLPSVYLHLGNLEDDENRMQMLVGTGAAMTTGDLKYHHWAMSQCSDIVEEYLQREENTEYDVVNLLAHLGLSRFHTDVDHGRMTVVIRYKTPYTINGNIPFVLSFALDNDTGLCCVFGLPTLLAMGATIGLVSGSLSCKELNRKFPLDLQPQRKGLPEGSSLNHNTHTILLIVSTNVLHHTSAEGTYRVIC